jgi:hypothetical protein
MGTQKSYPAWKALSFFQCCGQHVCYRWICPLYFQLPYLPEDTCFQQGGSSAVEGTSQRKVLASLSLFLKSEKIPALPYGGKGLQYKSFHDFQCVPLAYWPWVQISKHGRTCNQALLLYIIVPPICRRICAE